MLEVCLTANGRGPGAAYSAVSFVGIINISVHVCVDLITRTCSSLHVVRLHVMHYFFVRREHEAISRSLLSFSSLFSLFSSFSFLRESSRCAETWKFLLTFWTFSRCSRPALEEVKAAQAASSSRRKQTSKRQAGEKEVIVVTAHKK